MKKTDVLTCQCENPDVEFLDSRYIDHWVCRQCHCFGGCCYPTDISVGPNKHKSISTHRSSMRYKPMNQCSHDHNVQHLEDKLDDFRNAVHDKVLGYGAFAKGVGIGLLMMVIVIFLVLALGIFTFNPMIRSNPSNDSVAPTVPPPTQPPSTPFPTLP